MAGALTAFIGGVAGQWHITKTQVLAGPPLGAASRLAIGDPGEHLPPATGGWVLRGIPSYERYVNRPERQLLLTRQEGLGRRQATCAALVPIAKSEIWWDLTQDERRAVFEERSAHIRTGARYLPAIARRLYHCRDLGEPFDFLTWFEYAPQDEAKFDELVDSMRRTEEWRFVIREVDIRLVRGDR